MSDFDAIHRESSMPATTTARNPRRRAMGVAIRVVGISAFLVVCALTASLVWGGPKPIPPMRSISDPFTGVSVEGMPALSRFAARDGTQLAYRRYVPANGTTERGSVMLVHGSSANSQSVHPLAQSFAAAGYTVYAFDIRGHGKSGEKGRIGYIGQLDDDLEDFMKATRPAKPRTLVGFSAGGGFALRVAGSQRGALFDNFLFMSPYVHHRAVTNRSNDSGGWVSIGIPRVMALVALNRVEVTRFNQLPVSSFAVSDNPEADLTPWYSYALAANFEPQSDYRAGIRSIAGPAEVIVGQEDEIFLADKFRPLFDEAGRKDVPVTVVPATGHIALTLSDAGRTAAVAAVERLDARSARGFSQTP